MRRLEEIKKAWSHPDLNTHKNKALEDIFWLLRRVDHLEEMSRKHLRNIGLKPSEIEEALSEEES